MFCILISGFCSATVSSLAMLYIPLIPLHLWAILSLAPSQYSSVSLRSYQSDYQSTKKTPKVIIKFEISRYPEDLAAA